MTDTPEHEAVGEWLSTREAAARLKITERSVFRRIRKGALEKRTTEDGGVMVRLTPEPSRSVVQPMSAMSRVETRDQPAADDGLVQPFLVMCWLHQMAADVFRGELRERDDRVAQQAEEIGRLKAELAWYRQPWWRRLTGTPVMTGT